METALLKELLLLALADVFYENNECTRAWGGLSSVGTKLEPAARSESNVILETNVLQKFSPHAIYLYCVISFLCHLTLFCASKLLQLTLASVYKVCDLSNILIPHRAKGVEPVILSFLAVKNMKIKFWLILNELPNGSDYSINS